MGKKEFVKLYSRESLILLLKIRAMDILTKYDKELNSFCKSNRIKKLSLFGSRLKKTEHEGSDVDLLVEFLEGSNYGLLDLMRIERELSELIGEKVDLKTPEELSSYFRDTVVKEASVKYEATR